MSAQSSDDTFRYQDILYKKRPPSRHPKMSLKDRAAQFLPFDALTGLDEAIDETARVTSEAPDYDDVQLSELNERLQTLLSRLKEQPEITVTFYEPDARKEGGAYFKRRGRVRLVDLTQRLIIFTDGAPVALDRVQALEGGIFGG